MSEVAGFVLAGGKSTRMGRDKAFLPWADGTLLSHALESVSSVTKPVFILGDKSKFARYGPVVEDVYRDCGPLGGIHAALSSTSTPLNLIFAVDMPFVEARFLPYLISRAKDSAAVVTLPRVEHRWQPLCAVYRRAFLEAAEQSLRAGKNKIDALFAEVETCVIEESELSAAGYSAEMFRNLNTHDDWEKAKRRS